MPHPVSQRLGVGAAVGEQFKGAIDKMALVGKMQGNKKWQKAADKAMEPFYAKSIQYFESDDDAWDWLNS